MGAQLRLGASFSVLITNVCYYIFTDNKQRKSYYNVKIIFEEITGHEKETISVQKINVPKYGDCLVSHGKDGLLKIWSYLNN